MSEIAVIDYGMGNLRSVAKALETVAPRAKISVTADPAVINAASHIVFPGVGAIRAQIAKSWSVPDSNGSFAPPQCR